MTSTATLFAFGLGGPQDWIIIGVIVLVLFGGNQIPKLARGVGESLREFRKISEEADGAVKDAKDGLDPRIGK